MADPYDTLAKPEGTLEDVTTVTSTMSQRFRTEQSAINLPSQDTVPERT